MASPSPFFNISTIKNGRQFQVNGKQLALSPNEPSVFLLTIDEPYSTATLRKELSKAKHMTYLVASASHELRTPLGGIVSTLEIMKGSVSRDLEKYHEIALTSSIHLLSTVNDILVSQQMFHNLGLRTNWRRSITS